jgi:hypothetical protein
VDHADLGFRIGVSRDDDRYLSWGALGGHTRVCVAVALQILAGLRADADGERLDLGQIVHSVEFGLVKGYQFPTVERKGLGYNLGDRGTDVKVGLVCLGAVDDAVHVREGGANVELSGAGRALEWPGHAGDPAFVVLRVGDFANLLRVAGAIADFPVQGNVHESVGVNPGGLDAHRDLVREPERDVPWLDFADGDPNVLAPEQPLRGADIFGHPDADVHLSRRPGGDEARDQMVRIDPYVRAGVAANRYVSQAPVVSKEAALNLDPARLVARDVAGDDLLDEGRPEGGQFVVD